MLLVCPKEFEVDSKIRSVAFKKFRITCLIESVESTVEIPSLVPSKEANVLFPVPDVPASKTMTLILDCIRSEARRKSLILSGF